MLCDRVTIICSGRTVQRGTLGELRQLSRTSVSAQADRPPAGLDALPGVYDVDLDGAGVSFTVDNEHLGAAMRGVTSRTQAAGFPHKP